MSTRGNNNNETVYEYSNTENVGANNEYAPPPQPNRPPNVRASLSPQQILDLVKSLDYSRVEAFLRELPSEQLTWFRQQPFIYVVVKEMVNQYKQRYGTDSADVASDEMLEGGLRLLNLFKENLQMNVYQGETETSKDRPGNVAARANSSIAIPILQVLMRNHNQDILSRTFSMHILQPDGMYERKQARDGTITLTAPKGEKAPLFDAIENNQFKTVEYLVKEGSQINKIKDPVSGDSPLAVAILQSINKEIATFLKENRANVNAIDKYGEPLLQSIIRNQFNWETGMPYADGKTKGEIRLFFVDFIAKSPFYSPSRDGQGRDPVYVATIQGCPRILATLLRIQSIKSFLRNSLREPFIYAASNSSYVSPDVVVNTNGKRAKMDELVKFFLQQMEFQIPDHYELTDPTRGQPIFLFESAITKDMELLRLLKNRNFLTGGYSNAFRQRLQGDTNLITYAVQKKKLDSLKLLAEHAHFKEMVNIPDDGLRLPLIEAVRANEPEILQFLLDKNADVNKQAGQGETPLTVAMRTNPELVKFLIEKGANVNQPGANGETPLLLAIRTAPEFVKVLLDRGADPNQSDKNGNFPLLLALDAKDNDLVELLKSKGAKMDGLLAKAAMASKVDLVKDLLEKSDVDPTSEITLDGNKYTIYDVTPSMEIRLLFAPYFEKDQPRFRGFTRGDFALFQEFWDKEANYENTCICPICFTVNNRGSGCFYQDHNCERLAAENYAEDKQKEARTGVPAKMRHFHKKLFDLYMSRNLALQPAIIWCLKCNRICLNPTRNSHAHFDCAAPALNKKAPYVYAGDPYGATNEEYCYDSRGGFIVEKLFRLQKLLEFMCELNKNFVGKISQNMALNLTKEYFMYCGLEGKQFFECGDKPGIFTVTDREGRTVRSPLNRDIVLLHTKLKEYDTINTNLQTLRDLATLSAEDIQDLGVDFLQELLEFMTILKNRKSQLPKLTDIIPRAQLDYIGRLTTNFTTILAVLENLTPIKAHFEKQEKDMIKLQQIELALESVYAKLMKEFGLPAKSIGKQNVWTKELDELEQLAQEAKATLEERNESENLVKLQTTLLDEIAKLKDAIEALNQAGNTEKTALFGTLIQQLNDQSETFAELQEIIDSDPNKFQYEDQYNDLVRRVGIDATLLKQILTTNDTIRKNKQFIFPDDCPIIGETAVENNAANNNTNVPFVNTIGESLKPFKIVKYNPDGTGEGDQTSCTDPNQIEGDFMCGVHYDNHDDHRDLYKFCHRQPDGTFFNHTGNYACKYGIIEHIESVINDKQTGMVCFDSTVCKGVLHPNEIKPLFMEPIVLDDSFKDYINDGEARKAGRLFEQAEEARQIEFEEMHGEWDRLPANDKLVNPEPQLVLPKRSDFPPKQYNWDTEGEAVKTRTQAEFKRLWEIYNAMYIGVLKDAAKKAAKGGAAPVEYSFYAVEDPGEIQSVCPLKRRVKGGYRKTRRSKKILKTRKAKRYNRTRKH